MSVVDFLMDRHDSSLNFDVKVENEVRSELLEMDWPVPSDDFMNSILNGENLDDTQLLCPLEEILQDNYEVGTVSSVASDDVGLSSEPSLEQVSPIPPKLSFLPLTSDGSSDSESSSTMDCASLGDVQIHDNQAIISMNLVSPVDSMNQRIRRVIRMTPVTSSNDCTSARSILLPVSSLKGGPGVRTIHIINTSSGANLPPGFRVICNKSPPVQTPVLLSSSELHSEGPSDHCSEDSDGPQYPRLDLSTEEKRLLKKEGITLPTHYPLTKMEERELKRIRRKIRNKISAQDSRKRKKEYVDGLEDRVKRCTDENASLQKRVRVLQSQNTTLAAQVKRLQNMLTQGTATRQVQPATCLMVLLLSLALVVVPNLRNGQNTSLEDSPTELSVPAEKAAPVAGRSRTLLYKYPVCNEEHPFNFDGEEVVEDLCSPRDPDYEPPTKAARVIGCLSNKPLEIMDVDDVWPPPKAPPDVTQDHIISSSYFIGKWPIEMTQKLDAMIEDNIKPNSTSDTQTVLISISNDK